MVEKFLILYLFQEFCRDTCLSTKSELERRTGMRRLRTTGQAVFLATVSSIQLTILGKPIFVKRFVFYS